MFQIFTFCFNVLLFDKDNLIFFILVKNTVEGRVK